MLGESLELPLGLGVVVGFTFRQFVIESMICSIATPPPSQTHPSLSEPLSVHSLDSDFDPLPLFLLSTPLFGVLFNKILQTRSSRACSDVSNKI